MRAAELKVSALAGCVCENAAGLQDTCPPIYRLARGVCLISSVLAEEHSPSFLSIPLRRSTWKSRDTPWGFAQQMPRPLSPAVYSCGIHLSMGLPDRGPLLCFIPTPPPPLAGMWPFLVQSIQSKDRSLSENQIIGLWPFPSDIEEQYTDSRNSTLFVTMLSESRYTFW